ncbi:MAG: hypothetical protein KAI79_12310 [Bacteroidales bacterium]|nr:hypothetical protein [Bacteroidales bacterium]
MIREAIESINLLNEAKTNPKTPMVELELKKIENLIKMYYSKYSDTEIKTYVAHVADLKNKVCWWEYMTVGEAIKELQTDTYRIGLGVSRILKK